MAAVTPLSLQTSGPVAGSRCGVEPSTSPGLVRAGLRVCSEPRVEGTADESGGAVVSLHLNRGTTYTSRAMRHVRVTNPV
ncbi:unnamed protein product [Gadus morhua 'NCC']